MVKLECARLFSDDRGESHFGTTTIAFDATNFAPPAPPLEVTPIVAARHGFLYAAAGWFGDWHPAPARQYMCLVSGSLEVSTSDGETRVLDPGTVVLLEDTVGVGHRTRVVSGGPALLMFAQLA